MRYTCKFPKLLKYKLSSIGLINIWIIVTAWLKQEINRKDWKLFMDRKESLCVRIKMEKLLKGIASIFISMMN